MPFTPAHAVVALPFVRTPLVPAAIAVGAMAPDLPLFMRGTPLTYELLHTTPLLTMMVALALLAVWYLLLRPAVRELAPAGVARRLPGEWDATGAAAWTSMRAPRTGARHPIWREIAVFAPLLALALFIGVLSHTVWDAFTHEGRWGVRAVPALAAEWGPLLGYKWMQYGSSVGGVLVLAVCAALWLRRRPTAPAPRVLPGAVRTAWWLSLPAILLAAWGWGLVAYGSLDDTWTPQHLAYRVLPPACAVWGVATVVLCVVVVSARARSGPTADVGATAR